MRLLLAATAALSLIATPALAGPCKDAKGKFIKCPTTHVKAGGRCKIGGKFAKCGTPGAKPV